MTYIYTRNYGKSTGVNFTIILVAALIGVHRTTKNNSRALFAHISNAAATTFQ